MNQVMLDFIVAFLHAFADFLAYESVQPLYALLLLLIVVNIFMQLVNIKRF